MKKRSFHLKKETCFRRWSRKAYAIFVSLGLCVTIGRLNIQVADSSLSKLKGKTSILPNVKEYFLLGATEDGPDTGPVSVLLLGILGYDRQSVSILKGNHTSGIDSFVILRI